METKEETIEKKPEYQAPVIITLTGSSGTSCWVGGGDGGNCCAGRSVSEY
jgi:hypothetical protein